MLSQNITVIFFILIILIFIICIFFMSNINNCESFTSKEQEETLLSIKEENKLFNAKLVEKFAKKQIKFNILKKPNKIISKYQTFYDTSIYPELTNINYSIVKNELLNYINQPDNNWIEWPEYDLWKNNNPSSSWTIIPLMSFSKWSDKNTKKFPKTTTQLKKIKGLVSAGFSKLGTNTTLSLHKGWGNLSNNILRCHLGLIVPESKCKIFVMGISNDSMYQEESKWIIFDDSLYHSASNEDNSKDRIILLVDIERPSYIEKGISDIDNSLELNNFIDEFNKNL